MDLGFGFLLKKSIAFFFMPLTIGVILMVLALWSLHRERTSRAKKLIIFSALWVVLISYAPIANALLISLERQHPRLEQIPEGVEHILLLGGDRRRRAWEASRLYHMKPNLKIITSGRAMHDTLSEARKAQLLLMEGGVPEADILRQDEAKDTAEEADALKARLGERPFLLVTSAYHMPRAMRIFEGLGLQPIAAPGDFNRPEEDGLTSALKGRHLRKTEKAFHEYMGLLWLALRGG